MTDQHDEMVSFAVSELKNFLASDGYDWFGPVALVLVQELKISIGPYQLDYGNDKVLAGHNTCLPEASVKRLCKFAGSHLEAYRLLRLLLSDLVKGGEKMPKDLRDLASLFLLDAIKPPKPLPQSNRKLLSRKTFLRDYAVCHTLEKLRDQFCLAPTDNKATKKMTGPKIIEKAFRQINQDRSRKQIALLPSLSISGVNAVWEKRKVLGKLSREANKELDKCYRDMNKLLVTNA